MNKFEVKAGYHEWNIYRNGELFYTVDDSNGQLAEDQTQNESIEDFYYFCYRLVCCVGAETSGMTLDDIDELLAELFTVWAHHFGYDENEIGEWNGSAVTNIAIVEDGDGKIHEFMKIIDERERCMLDAFQSEVQGWADELGGVILAIYRMRDVVQRCWL